MAGKTVRMLYGREGMELSVPESTAVLEGRDVPALADPEGRVLEALERPIGSPPLRELLRRRRPKEVAITISDITRPVPNRLFMPPLLQVLNRSGVADERILIIIGTGMHRPSTAEERELLLGPEVLRRVEVIDHRAEDPETLVRVREDPPVYLCRRFAEAPFKIVTGYIEPHFMAGFSGGRKGVCPALVDLRTIQRFHGFRTLADPRADNGVLEGNPCHRISLEVARAVGVDFLLNVALTRGREIAGLYCGHLEEAHLAGCRQVAEWTTAEIEAPFDLVVTNGGGFPLDLTFYQTVKGMCTALPALHAGSTLLQVSRCAEGLGSGPYAELMLRWGKDWPGFLREIEAHQDRTLLDQWELQMQARVLERIGVERLWLVSDGLEPEAQRRICITPVERGGGPAERAQAALDGFLSQRPKARVAAIPDGPYTMLRVAAA